jgi:hypothetical protein
VNPPNQPSDAVRRHARAREHIGNIKDFAGEAIRSLADEPHEIRSHFDTDRRQYIVEWSVPEIAERIATISVMVGEAAYNLRAALDYLINELSFRDSRKRYDSLQFPIEDSPEGFQMRCTGLRKGEQKPNERVWWLRGINQAHIDAIENVQPYRGCQWTKTLRGLSNPDKHRRLTILNERFDPGVPDITVRTGPIYPSDDLYPSETMPGRGYTGVEVKIDLSLYIAFEDGTPVVETLEELKSEVGNFLAEFYPAF